MTNYPEVRIISLWQPWASLIALELKQYETRSWGTSYRGVLAIHATKTQPVCINAELERVAQKIELRADRERLAKSLPMPQSCIVAIATLANCQKMTALWHPGKTLASPSLIYADETTELEEECGDWSEGRFAWKLEDVISCLDNPIPYKGGQGLRSMPPDDVERLIRPRIMRALEVQP